MPVTRGLVRAGLAGVAAVVLLSGCGGSGNGSSASPTTAATTAATAKAADSAFCRQSQQLVTNVQSTLSSSTDTSQLPQQLQQVADALHGVTPPKAIASDWNAFADDIASLGKAYAGTNFDDPQSTASFQQTATQLQGKLTTEGAHLQSFLGSECGIGASTSSSSASSTS